MFYPSIVVLLDCCAVVVFTGVYRPRGGRKSWEGMIMANVEHARFMEAAVQGAIECALWLGMRMADDEESESVDLRSEDVPADVEDGIRADVVDFVLGNTPDCVAYAEGLSAADIGHDFMLTRNSHGAGFWDRGLGELGDRLTAAAKVYGEQMVVVGSDGVLSLI